MTSMLGLLEARETSARERVEVLREEAARATAALEADEVELDRRVIDRDELVEALAASAVESTATMEAEGGEEVAPAPPGAGPRRFRGRSCRPGGRNFRCRISVDKQRIVNVLQDRPGGDAMRAKDIAAALGLDTSVAAKVEGVRSKAMRHANRQGPDSRHSARTAARYGEMWCRLAGELGSLRGEGLPVGRALTVCRPAVARGAEDWRRSAAEGAGRARTLLVHGAGARLVHEDGDVGGGHAGQRATDG